MVTHSRESNLLTSETTHASSIPSLPPVVKDSWFKDKVARQNLDGLKRRLLQKDADAYEVYLNTEENKPNENAPTPEVPYYSKGNQAVRTFS